MHKKISVDELRIGMYVSALDRPWEETRFLFQGFPVETEEQLDELRGLCEYVFIDTERAAEPRERLRTLKPGQGTTSQRQRAIHAGSAQHEHTDEQDPKALAQELGTARRVFEGTKGFVDTAMEDVRLGRSVDTDAARDNVSAIVNSVLRNASALMLMTNLKSRDEYTSIHCVNVCILSVAFGRHLELDADELNELGLGALLHDIGKMRVPLEILNKPGRLTEEEFEIMKRHSTIGREMLKNVEDLPPRSLDVVFSHHERADGSGYPQGLREGHISQFAMMVALVDVYDAVTSDRVYHAAISPHDALSMMYDHTPVAFDKTLYEEFIKCLGIFPVGSLVELNTGQIGMVMTVNRKRHLKPIVMLLLDPEKQPYLRRKLVNLATSVDEDDELHITRILESSAYSLNVRDIVASETATMN